MKTWTMRLDFYQIKSSILGVSESSLSVQFFRLDYTYATEAFFILSLWGYIGTANHLKQQAKYRPYDDENPDGLHG